jgi:hypothetical protein
MSELALMGAARASRLNPPSSSSLADETTHLLAPPPYGGARLPTLAAENKAHRSRFNHSILV